MNRRHFLATSSLTAAASAQAASPAKIKIVQIGTAHPHAAGKMQVYRSSPDFDVVGLVEPDDTRFASATKSNTYRNLPRLSLDQALATPGLQAAAIETSVAGLLANAAPCIDAGLHIHLDKPAGTSLPQFTKLLQKADAKNLTVQLGYMYRFNPAVERLHQFIADGWLGDIVNVDASMGKVLSPGARKEIAEFNGGIMFELACHVIDLVVKILGEPESVTPNVHHHGSDGLADDMLAVFTYPKANATVRASAIEVDGFAARHLTVRGTKGSFHIQPLDRPTVTLALDQPRGDYKKGTQTIPLGTYPRYVGDAKQLAQIIHKKIQSPFPSTHDLATQRTVLKASNMPT